MVIEKRFYRGWRTAVCLDLKPLPVEVCAAVIVRRYVNMKDKHGFAQVAIHCLGDMVAEAGMAAIGCLGAGAEHAGDQGIAVGVAISGKKRLREHSRNTKEKK